MSFKFGPVIKFHGTYSGEAQYSVLAGFDTLDEQQPLSIDGQTYDPKILLTKNGLNICSYFFRIKINNSEQTIDYSIAGLTHQFVVPAKNEAPRIAYCSCNGFSSAKEIGRVEFKDNMWISKKDIRYCHSGLLDENEKKKFHLLIMGGDQVYADSIFHEVGDLKGWMELDFEQRVHLHLDDSTKAAIDDFYFNLYIERWGSGAIKSALSSIPTIMMWDDHDIIDGWGSYHPNIQKSNPFVEIFKCAQKYFSIFQQHTMPTQKPPSSFSPYDQSMLIPFNSIAILALDLRSNRTIDRVIHSGTHDAIKHLTTTRLTPETFKHLFVLSSIPVAHPDMSWADSFAEAILPHEFEIFDLMDDLRDHWNSVNHKTERLRLIHNLLRISHESQIRVTILSGDVHVAATGVIKDERPQTKALSTSKIFQITSSGIVHPGPPKVMKYLYDILSIKEQEIDTDIKVQMLPFSGTSTKFLLKRNWASLIPDSEAKYWFNIHSEETKQIYEKPIHPI